MSKKMRFSIRFKLAIISMITITISVLTLAVVLSASYRNSAYETASSNLSNVSSNAYLALKGSLSNKDTSMNLLANQIGNNKAFANNIKNVSTSLEAEEKITTALAGEDGLGDGSTLLGTIDYLVSTDSDIITATMYSPYVNDVLIDRLYPVNRSVISYEDNKERLNKEPGKSLWFFKGDNELYVWKALVNFGVDDLFDMDVVGYIEYSLHRNQFLGALSETKYQDEGMYLFDENNTLVLSISCGDTSIDKTILDNISSYKEGQEQKDSYTVNVSDNKIEGWRYVSFISHNSINKAVNQSTNATIIIVFVSVFVSAFVAFLLSNSEVKRIKNLSKASSAIALGDYKTQVTLKGNDEITDVSESFNIMAKRIQEALKELIEQQDSISENFATILSNKSGESGNHVKRVGEYSAILASELGFNENEIHDIKIASMLHDVGKIMVDESILHKPGKFTDEEYKIMQEHVTYGGKLLEGVPGNIMQLGAKIALYHHERYDGNGYVNKLKGDDIPKEAQITSVADVFDALVSKRCYKGAWTMEDAYKEIVAQSGKQFAPDVVKAFQKRFEDFKHIATIYKEEDN